MPKLPLAPAEFRKRLSHYDQATERRIRDTNAARGEPATRAEANAFFKRELARLGRRFGKAIDLGCNTGTFAKAILAPRCRELVLVDFSEKALAKARQTLSLAAPPSSRPSPPRGRRSLLFLRADLTRDWKKIAAPGTFDLVALCEVIQHVPSAAARRRIFRRAARLVAPGGLFLFSHYARVRGEPAEGFFHSPRYPELLYFSCLAVREVHAMARTAGLAVLRRARTDPVNAFVMRRRR